MVLVAFLNLGPLEGLEKPDDSCPIPASPELPQLRGAFAQCHPALRGAARRFGSVGFLRLFINPGSPRSQILGTWPKPY